MIETSLEKYKQAEEEIMLRPVKCGAYFIGVLLQEFAKRGLSINEGIPATCTEALGRKAVDVYRIFH